MDDIENTNLGVIQIRVGTIVMVVTSFIVVCFRLASRWYFLKRLRLDDILMILGFVSLYLQRVLLGLGTN
jgi:hypothetical protein